MGFNSGFKGLIIRGVVGRRTLYRSTQLF